MSAGLDEVDRAVLTHAYGSAADVRGQPAALCGPDEKAAERALDGLPDTRGAMRAYMGLPDDGRDDVTTLPWSFI